jgi:hypothetical protein
MNFTVCLITQINRNRYIIQIDDTGIVKSLCGTAKWKADLNSARKN